VVIDLPSYWHKKREIMEYYDRLADTYNSLYLDEQILKIKYIFTHVKIHYSDLILDAGCGTGFLFRSIYPFAGHIIGVDLSKEILKVALANVKHFGMKRISLIRADVDFLPFREKVFHKVFVLTLLQDSPKIDMTLREISRTATDESIIVVTGLKKLFSEKSLKQAIIKGRLNPTIIQTQEQIKDIIAICLKNIKVKNK